MHNDFCLERVLSYQNEYDYIKKIGFSIKGANQFLGYLKEQANCIKKGKAKDESFKESEIVLLEQLKLKRDTVTKYLFYLKKYHSINREKIAKQVVKKELSKRQIMLLDKLNDKDFSLFKFDDYYDLYVYVLENDFPNAYELLDILIDGVINLYYAAEVLEKDDIYVYLNKLKQLTNSYIRNKEMTNLRPLIGKIKKIKNYHNLKEEKKDNSFYEIIEFLTLQPNGNLYIKRILERSSSFSCDVVNIVDEADNHIVYDLFDMLLDSCLIELRNQEKDYVKKEHFKNLILLFLNHPNSKITKDDIAKIQLEIVNFNNYVREHKYKNGAVIENFLTNLFKVDIQEKAEFPDYYSKECPTFSKKDLSNEYTISLYNDPKHINKAYSAKMKESGNCVIKIHIADVSSYVIEGTDLDKYLKDKVFKEEEFLPSDLVDTISLNQGKERCAITYEIEINGKGRIINYNIYESIIKVDKSYKYDEFLLADLKEDEKLYPLFYIYFFVNPNRKYEKYKFGYELEGLLCNLIKRIVSNYFEKSNIPLIYRLRDERDIEEYQNLMNNLVGLFGKINPSDASLLHQIIIEDHNYAYYGLEDKGHISFKNNLNLFNPMDSYIDLTIQRLVKEFLVHENEYDDVYRKYLESIVEAANQRLEEIRSLKQKKHILSSNPLTKE